MEWHPNELYPRVGFIVTNLARSAERVVAYYNQRGTAEQWIREGKGAIKWTRLSCRSFAANAVRLQLHALTRAISCGCCDAQSGGVVVADPPAREAYQGPREGRQPRRYHVPNGRGRGVMANVLGYPVAHRPAANAARAGVRGAGSDDATGDDGRSEP